MKGIQKQIHKKLRQQISIFFAIVGGFFGIFGGSEFRGPLIGLISGYIVGQCFAVASLSIPRSQHVLIRIALGILYGGLAGAVSGMVTAMPLALFTDCHMPPIAVLMEAARIGAVPGITLGLLCSIAIARERKNEGLNAGNS